MRIMTTESARIMRNTVINGKLTSNCIGSMYSTALNCIAVWSTTAQVFGMDVCVVVVLLPAVCVDACVSTDADVTAVVCVNVGDNAQSMR